MKVLTIVTDLSKGGTQRVAQLFANTYSELSAESKVLCIHGLGPRVDELYKGVGLIEYISIENLDYIKNWSPDLVHIHTTNLKDNDLNPLWNVLDPKTIVVETNVFSIPSPWEKHLDYSLQLGSWAEWLYLLRGGNKSKSLILPNPVDTESFKKASEEEIIEFKSQFKIPLDAKVMGRIGQSVPSKWSPMLVEIFNEISEEIQDLYLVLVNPPDNILDLTKNSRFSNRIIHIEKIIGDKALSTAYSSFDVVAHIAERGESFGMVLTESILCDTPVVTLHTPWGDNCQGEVLGHGKGGLVVNSKKGFKKAILAVLRKKVKVDLRNKGSKHIIDNFERVKLSNQVLSLSIDRKKVKLKRRTSIIKLLSDSYDQPALLTSLFLLSKLDLFRRLTIYTSGYKPLGQILIAFTKRVKNLS